MKTDRLIGILCILLKKEKVTAPYLAEKFEVSRRTVNRDIENLCLAGIPIVTTRGKAGGISIMDGYKIDKTLLTSSDMQAVLAGLKGLDSVSKTNKYKQLMEKLSPDSSSMITTNNHIVIDLSSWQKSALTQKIDLIRTAIDSSLRLNFTYYSPKGETIRTIEPYLLIFQWSSWYMWGYCTLRKEFRMFKLNRMVNIQISSETFVKTNDMPNLNSQGYHKSKSAIRASVLVDKEIQWHIIDEFGIEALEHTKKGLIFNFEWYSKESLFRWLASVGTQAELVQPEGLRKEFSKNLKKIRDIYK